MTTDLMLRGFESRTIRPAAAGTVRNRRMRHLRNHHRQTPRRRFFPLLPAGERSLSIRTGVRLEACVGNPRYSNGYRRRRERERWRHMRADCYICHRPIDYELKAPHPYSFVVDETIALARGGTLTHDNSGPAHRWCNAIKGTHSLAWARERVAQLIAQGKAPQRTEPTQSGPIRCSDWFGGGE